MTLKPKEEYIFESLIQPEEVNEELVIHRKDSFNLLSMILVVSSLIFIISVASGIFRLSLMAVYLILVFCVLKYVEKRIKGKILFAISLITLVFLIIMHTMFSTGTLYLVDELEMEKGMSIKIQNLGIQEEELSKLFKKSSNTDVIAIHGNEIIAKSAGESILTFSDIFGNRKIVNYKVIDSEVFTFHVGFFSEISVGEEVWLDVYPLPHSFKTIYYDVEILEGNEFGEILDVGVDQFSNGSQKVKALRGLKKGTMKIRVSTEEYGFKDYIVKVSNEISNFLISPMLDGPVPSLNSPETIYLDSPANILIQPVSSNLNKDDLACSVNSKKVRTFDQNGFFEVYVEGYTEIVCTHDNKISNVLTLDVGGELYAR